MVSVEQALEKVLAEAKALPARETRSAEGLGLILAEDITADSDSPSADKSLVDGYALLAEDLMRGITDFRVLEQVMAGTTPSQAIESGTATQIMTGAPIPRCATMVVMVEHTERIRVARPDDARVTSDERRGSAPHALPSSFEREATIRVKANHVSEGQNIMRQGASMRSGQTILCRGHFLRAIELGLLAEVGRTDVRVIPRPSVAVVSTGNELVDVEHMPRIGQLRNSNGPMLSALATSAGGLAVNLGIARDTEADLKQKIENGFSHEVLVLSGGVSAGVLDLVPQVLSSLGVRTIYHKVHLKPGKPMWFGVREVQDQRTLVFGLPGNPVSSLVCFELFVRPALRQLAGGPPSGLPTIRAELTSMFQHRGDRPTYFPARVEFGSSVPQVRLLNWQGSADLRTLVDANGLVMFQPGDCMLQAGEQVSVMMLAKSRPES